MPGSTRSHALPRRSDRLPAAGLFVRLAPALERLVQVVALPVPQVAPLPRRVTRLVAPLARLLGDQPPRLFARRRRHQQRHGRPGDRPEHECHDDGARSAVISRHMSPRLPVEGITPRSPLHARSLRAVGQKMLTRTLRYFLGSCLIAAISSFSSFAAEFILSYISLLCSSWPAVPWPEFRFFVRSSSRVIVLFSRSYSSFSVSSFP